jgi:hypothetical protein
VCVCEWVGGCEIAYISMCLCMCMCLLFYSLAHSRTYCIILTHHTHTHTHRLVISTCNDDKPTKFTPVWQDDVRSVPMRLAVCCCCFV